MGKYFHSKTKQWIKILILFELQYTFTDIMDIQSLLNPTPSSPSIQRQIRLFQHKQQRAKRANELSRDEKIEVRALRKYTNFTYDEIAYATHHTVRQVQSACTNPLTPQKSRSGRQGLIRTPDKRQLKTWLKEDDFHRQIPWQDLPFFLPPNLAIYSYHSIITALRSMGYKRAIRPRRIKLTEANKRARVNFAKEQLQLRPRPKDWENVDFSDET